MPKMLFTGIIHPYDRRHWTCPLPIAKIFQLQISMGLWCFKIESFRGNPQERLSDEAKEIPYSFICHFHRLFSIPSRYA